MLVLGVVARGANATSVNANSVLMLVPEVVLEEEVEVEEIYSRDGPRHAWAPAGSRWLPLAPAGSRWLPLPPAASR